MRFRLHQARAQAATTRLFVWFALLLIGLAGAVNVLLAALYKLLVPWGGGYPALFFETNTALVILFVLGGCLVETQRLRAGGGVRVAHWLGGREVTDPDNSVERRLLNVVDEMALASGQPVPRVFVLPREDAINAFVAGWRSDDAILAVTRGALERLTRAELQGLVAHEFGHLKEGDLALTMRMIALVWGLSLVHGYGQSLMSADEAGRVHPISWLCGLVFACIGWLGWLAGRMLQAAVSRQREFLADASAIQFTRTRDGLGNVLRKLWHDEQVLAGRMQAPAAGMIASLLMHEPGGTQWLASHPQLTERIRRVCGTVLSPLPAPLVREPVNEPRRRIPTAGSVVYMNGPAQPDAQPPAADPVQRAQDAMAVRLHADREAMTRLQHRHGPKERRLIVLGLMMNAGNQREQRFWQRVADDLPHAQRILDDIADLLPSHRLPLFEQLSASMQDQPIEERRLLVEQARDMLRADGRVSPRDRLWWLALRHRMGVQGVRQDYLRPVTGTGQGLADMGEDERLHVAMLTAYLARFIPTEDPNGQTTLEGRRWLADSLNRCGLAVSPEEGLPPPDADALMLALSVVQEMSWMLRPQLLRAWVEEAFNHSPLGTLGDATADALRLVAMLVDAPMPPMLAAHYAHTATRHGGGVL